MKHNNAILTETKNAAVANDIATRIDLIKSKETEVEKISMSINMIVNDEINLSKFKRRRSDR